MLLVEMRMSLFWIVLGQIRMSTPSQLLPGAESENRRWSTIGSDEWLLNTIVLRNSCLAGLSTDKAPPAARRPPTNFLMPLFTGLEIRIPGSELGGRKAKDWQSWSHIVERY